MRQGTAPALEIPAFARMMKAKEKGRPDCSGGPFFFGCGVTPQGQETQAPIIATSGINASTTGTMLRIASTLFYTVSCTTGGIG